MGSPITDQTTKPPATLDPKAQIRDVLQLDQPQPAKESASPSGAPEGSPLAPKVTDQAARDLAQKLMPNQTKGMQAGNRLSNDKVATLKDLLHLKRARESKHLRPLSKLLTPIITQKCSSNVRGCSTSATQMKTARKLLKALDTVLKSNASLKEKREAVKMTIAGLKELEGLLKGEEKKWFKKIIHTELYGIYRDTADPKTRRSPYFDTDGDGTYDNEDACPLNGNYQKDSDGDKVPDKIDAYPNDAKRWDNLQVGKKYRMKGFKCNGGYEVEKLPNGKIVYRVRIYLKPDKGLSEAEVKRFKAKVKAQAQAYFSKRLGKRGIKFELSFVDSPGKATTSVNLHRHQKRENTKHWGLNTTPRIATHEIGHYLGLGDYYHEQGKWNDRTYRPGWTYMTPDDLMNKNGPKVRPEDKLIPGARANPPGLTPASQRLAFNLPTGIDALQVGKNTFLSLA